MSSRDRPHDDELEERLDELEDVLSELRADLRASERDRWLPGSSGSRRETEPRRPPEVPRPPRLSELVKFTEQYTIPTVIALLETTIKSLKLVQGTLRLLDPERDVHGDAATTAGRLADVRDGAADGLARSLSELRTALAEADLPEEAASRSIIEDARDLTAEIEARIEDGRRQADDARYPNRRTRGERDDRVGARGDGSRRNTDGRDEASRNEPRGAVHIDVNDPDEDRKSSASRRGDADDETGTDDSNDDRPTVDVESELDSIKRQLDAVERGDDAAAADDADDAGDTDDAAAVDDAEDAGDTDDAAAADDADDAGGTDEDDTTDR